MACNTRSSEKQRRLSLVEESACGVTPTTPTFYIIPHLSGSKTRTRRVFERTQEIDSNRQGGKLLPGVLEAGDGSIQTNIVNEVAFDKLMESAIGAALAAVNLAVTVTFAAAGKTATRATGSFLTDTFATRLKVGDKVAPVGSTANRTAIAVSMTAATDTSVALTSAAAFPAATPTAPQWAMLVTGANIEFVKYTGISSNTLTGLMRGAGETTAFTHTTSGFAYPVWTISAVTALVLTFSSGDTVANDSSVSTTFYSNRKRAASGTTRKRFTLETYQQDVNEYKRELGVEVNTVEVAIALGQGQATFGVLGQNVAWTQQASSTYTAKRGSTPQTGTATGTLLTEDGVTLSGVYSCTIQINNGRARQGQLGSDEADHVSEGDFDVTVAMNIYHSGFARVQAHLNGGANAIVIRTIEQAWGDKYQWTLPRAKRQDIDEGTQANTVTEPVTLFAEKDDVGTDITNSKLIFEKIYG